MSGGSWVQSPVWPSFLFNSIRYGYGSVLCRITRRATAATAVIRVQNWNSVASKNFSHSPSADHIHTPVPTFTLGKITLTVFNHTDPPVRCPINGLPHSLSPMRCLNYCILATYWPQIPVLFLKENSPAQRKKWHEIWQKCINFPFFHLFFLTMTRSDKDTSFLRSVPNSVLEEFRAEVWVFEFSFNSLTLTILRYIPVPSVKKSSDVCGYNMGWGRQTQGMNASINASTPIKEERALSPILNIQKEPMSDMITISSSPANCQFHRRLSQAQVARLQWQESHGEKKSSAGIEGCNNEKRYVLMFFKVCSFFG